MDILINTDVIIDISTQRKPNFAKSSAAYAIAKENGHRLWCYTGSLQTLYLNIVDEVQKSNNALDNGRPRSKIEEESRKLIRAFAKDINWLAALAGDADVFAGGNPIVNQLTTALERLGDNAKLLTWDDDLLGKSEHAISPEKFVSEFCGSAQQSIPFIDLAAQQDLLRSQLERNLHTVLHSGKYILGPEIQELERKLADFVGVKHAISCSSGTDALLMPLMACDIGPGDAVFTTPFTFIATAEVIALLGATPIFVDIDPRTFNIDPEKLRQAIQQVKAAGKYRPRSIIPVDLFGLPADYDTIMTIAKEDDLIVLEDAAQGFGGIYKGRQAGSLGHVAATSFFPAKPLGAYGDGGAIFTDDDELAEKLVSVRVHGKGSHKYENVRIGLNGRLDTLQASLLLPKLDIFAQEVERRQEVASKYTEELSVHSPKLHCPLVPPNVHSAWAQYSLLCDERREFIIAELKKGGIPTVIYYPTPLHLQPAFSNLGYKTGNFPISESISQRIFSLPMSPYLTDQQSQRIINTVKNIGL